MRNVAKGAKVKTYLETATSIAVLLVSTLVVSIFVWSYLVQGSNPSFQGGLQKGKTLSQLPGIDYSHNPQTLLIAMSVKCKFCGESVRFYKQLAEARRGLGKYTQLVALFPEDEDTVRQYLRRNQLEIGAVAGSDLKSLNISGTPTIILVDRQGKIIDFWIGKLAEGDEQQVINVLNDLHK